MATLVTEGVATQGPEGVSTLITEEVVVTEEMIAKPGPEEWGRKVGAARVNIFVLLHEWQYHGSIMAVSWQYHGSIMQKCSPCCRPYWNDN